MAPARMNQFLMMRRTHKILCLLQTCRNGSLQRQARSMRAAGARTTSCLPRQTGRFPMPCSLHAKDFAPCRAAASRHSTGTSNLCL